MTSAWSQVIRMSDNAVQPSAECTKESILSFEDYLVGGYDLFHIQAMKQKKLSAILTDDADFSTIPQISVYTCNASVIRKAQASGRLVQ